MSIKAGENDKVALITDKNRRSTTQSQAQDGSVLDQHLDFGITPLQQKPRDVIH